MSLCLVIVGLQLIGLGLSTKGGGSAMASRTTLSPGNATDLPLFTSSMCKSPSSDRKLICSGLGLRRVPPVDALLSNRTFTLLLGNNKIQELMSGAFLGMTSLERLDLHSNLISKIEVGAFNGLKKLKRLDLSRNLIGCLNGEIFNGLPNLARLNLSGNVFSTLSHGTFDHLISLKSLDFQTSTLVCDCRLSWLVGWLKERSVTSTYTHCAQPSSLRGQAVTSLDTHTLTCDSPLPSPSFQMVPSRQQLVFRGDSLPLLCHAPSNGAVVTGTMGSESLRVTWFQNGRLVQPNASLGIRIQQDTHTHDCSRIASSLFISEVQLTSAGSWECRLAHHDDHLDILSPSDGRRGDEGQTVEVVVLDGGDTHYCPEERLRNNKGEFRWPRTLAGLTSSLPCGRSQSSSGAGLIYSTGGVGGISGGQSSNQETKAWRRCGVGGVWFDEGEYIHCPFEKDVTRILHIINQMPLNLTNAVSTAKQLHVYTDEAANFSDKMDVSLVADMLEKFAAFTNKYKELGDVCVDIASNLMQVQESVLRAAQEESRACSRVVETLRRIAAIRLTNGAQLYSTSSPNIAMETHVLKAGNPKGLTCTLFQKLTHTYTHAHAQSPERTLLAFKCNATSTSNSYTLKNPVVEASVQVPAPTILLQGNHDPTPSFSSTTPSPLKLHLLAFRNAKLFPDPTPLVGAEGLKGQEREELNGGGRKDWTVTTPVLMVDIDGFSPSSVLPSPLNLTLRPVVGATTPHSPSSSPLAFVQQYRSATSNPSATTNNNYFLSSSTSWFHPSSPWFGDVTDEVMDEGVAVGVWNVSQWGGKGAWIRADRGEGGGACVLLSGGHRGEGSASGYRLACRKTGSFAVLMDLQNRNNLFNAVTPLHPIIYAASLILAVTLLLIIGTYICHHRSVCVSRKSWHMLINVCIHILLCVVTFTGGVNQVTHTAVCQAVGILLHYSTLAVALWSGVSVRNIYKQLTRKHTHAHMQAHPHTHTHTHYQELDEPPPPPRPMLRFYLIGGGIPVIVCGITAAANIKNYGSQIHAQYCWMAWEPSLGAFYGPLAFVVAVDIVYFLVVLAMLRRYPGRRHELKDKQEALPTSTSTSSASSFVPIATVVATEEERRRLAETTTAMTGVVNDDGNLDDDAQLANEHGFAVQLRGVAASLGLFILLWGCGGVAVAAGRGGALGLTGACLYGGVALALSAFLLSQHMIGRRDVRAHLARSCPRPNSSQRQYPPSTSTANSCFCCRRRHVGLTDVAPFSVAMRASSNNPGSAHQLAPTLAPSSGESCATNRSHASSNLRPSAKLTNLQAEAQSRPLGHGPFHPLPLAPLDNSLTEPSVDNDITLHLNPPLQVCYTRSAGPSNVATATATTPTTINPPSAPPAPTTVTAILETNNNNGQIAVIPSSSSANGTAEGVVPGPFGRINRNRVRSWRAGRLAVLREYAYDVPTSAEGSNASHGSTRRSQVNPGAIRHHASRSHHANRSSSSRRASWNAIRNSNAGENNNRSSNKLASRNANSSEDTNRNASPNFLKSTSETLNGNGNIRHNGAPFRLPPRPNRYRHAHRHQKHTHHHHHGNQASRNRGRGSSSSDEECSRPNTHTKQRHNDVINLAHSHFHVKAQQSHESHNGSTTQTIPKTHAQSNTHTQSHHHGSDLVHLQKEKHCDVNDYTHAQSDTHICTQPIHDPNISEIAMYHTDTQSHSPLHDGNGTLELAYNDITDSILEIASKNSESMGAIDDNKDNDDESVDLAMSLCDEEDVTNRSICEKEVEEDHQGSFPFIPQFSSIHSSQASPHQQPPQMSPSRPPLPLPSSPTSSSPLSPSSPFFSPPSPLPSLDSSCSPDQLLLLSSSPSHYPPLPPLPLLLPLQDKEQNYGLNLAPPVNHASKTSNRTPNCSTSGQHQTSSSTADFPGANIGPGNFSQAPLNSEMGSPALDTGSVVGSLGPNQGSGGVLTASKGIHGTGFSCGPNIVSRPYQEFGTSSSGPEVVHGNRSCAADPNSRTSPVSPDSKTDYLGSKSGTGIGSPRPSVIPGTVSKFENHTAPLSLDPLLNTHNAPLPLKPPLSTEQSSTIGHPTVRTGLWKHETTV